jgi:hypothetical protein
MYWLAVAAGSTQPVGMLKRTCAGNLPGGARKRSSQQTVPKQRVRTPVVLLPPTLLIQGTQWVAQLHAQRWRTVVCTGDGVQGCTCWCAEGASNNRQSRMRAHISCRKGRGHHHTAPLIRDTGCSSRKQRAGIAQQCSAGTSAPACSGTLSALLWPLQAARLASSRLPGPVAVCHSPITIHTT